jgi:hypothetical protein
MADPTPTFTFQFDLDEAEQVRGSRAVLLRNRTFLITLGVLMLLPVAATVIFLLELLAQSVDLSVVIAAWIAVPLVGALNIYNVPRQVTKGVRKNNRAAMGPHTYTLTASGLAATSTGASANIEWANIHAIRESREFFLFYFASNWAHLLPKRVVGDEALPSLRSALRSWAGERAHLPSEADPSHRR